MAIFKGGNNEIADQNALQRPCIAICDWIFANEKNGFIWYKIVGVYVCTTAKAYRRLPTKKDCKIISIFVKIKKMQNGTEWSLKLGKLGCEDILKNRAKRKKKIASDPIRFIV